MSRALDDILQRLGEVVLGKPDTLRLALACLLAQGHLLIEDVPGVGKTTLALALARALGLDFQRVQFTSDLLPADVVGVSVYEPGPGTFRFHPGPVFAQVVLADEINRASPKTQSALLEAMAERQVTVDGVTRALPAPFFVVATQNPDEQAGTFPLPESQLDRFLMRLSMGYPDGDAERALLSGRDRRELLADLVAVANAADLAAWQQATTAVRTAPPLVDYVLALIQASRRHPAIRLGLSPRAGLALLHAAQAWALLARRDAVLPEDVQAVFVAVADHRLVAAGARPPEGGLARRLLAETPIP